MCVLQPLELPFWGSKGKVAEGKNRVINLCLSWCRNLFYWIFCIINWNLASNNMTTSGPKQDIVIIYCKLQHWKRQTTQGLPWSQPFAISAYVLGMLAFNCILYSSFSSDWQLHFSTDLPCLTLIPDSKSTLTLPDLKGTKEAIQSRSTKK